MPSGCLIRHSTQRLGKKRGQVLYILLDLYYIYNRSFWLDLSILFETVFVVIEKKGAC